MTVIHKSKSPIILLLCIIIMIQMPPSDGHGRMIEPPSRASAWRYGFKTPINYNDNELFCGGFTRQYQTNGGKCGECGDAWDLPMPRPNEYGGKYGLGVTVRKYNPGSVITIRIDLTTSHLGYYEFRLCDNINARQSCLDKHVLTILTGAPQKKLPSDLKTRFYPRFGSRVYELKAQLPHNFECSHCVLQWIYKAGNNWGRCPDGTQKKGCGPQEEFRACSDISIGKGAKSTIPEMDSDYFETKTISDYFIFITFFAILIVLFVLGAVYKMNSRKQLTETQQNSSKTTLLPSASPAQNSYGLYSHITRAQDYEQM